MCSSTLGELCRVETGGGVICHNVIQGWGGVVPGEADGVAETVCEHRLPLLVGLLRQLGEQQAEAVDQRVQEAAHQRLLALRRALAIHDQHARRFEDEKLVVVGQQRRETVLLGGAGWQRSRWSGLQVCCVYLSINMRIGFEVCTHDIIMCSYVILGVYK